MSEKINITKNRGGRPRKASGEQRSRRITVWVNSREQARYLVNASRAGETGADFARAKLCFEPDPRTPRNDNLNGGSFELVDALTRIGVDLHHVAPIILSTGHVPDEFNHLLERLEAVLDEVLPE